MYPKHIFRRCEAAGTVTYPPFPLYHTSPAGLHIAAQINTHPTAGRIIAVPFLHHELTTFWCESCTHDAHNRALSLDLLVMVRHSYIATQGACCREMLLG